jgi:hypothetical protein
MGRQVAPELKGTLKSSRLRKSIVSLQREKIHSAVSGTQLAKQMGHSLSTAQKYYNIEAEDEADARVANFIEQLTQGYSPPRVEVLAPETEGEESKEEPEQEQQESEQEQQQPPITTKEDEEQEEEEEEEESEDSERFVDKELNLSQRHELISLFHENLKSGRAVLKHFVQARVSRNRVLKGVDPDVAMKYVLKKKASDLSGVEKAGSWVHSNLNEVNTYAARSSGTSGRLFTDFQTLLIEEAIGSLPPNASGQKCVDAIIADERCKRFIVPAGDPSLRKDNIFNGLVHADSIRTVIRIGRERSV